MHIPKYPLLFLKGMAMGAADVVPGVSGGTIAFITGIYEELLNSLKAINQHALKVLLQQGPAAFWQQINGSFLLTLMAGIISSFLLLAHGIVWLMAQYPTLLWSFIAGLVLASTLHIGKQIDLRKAGVGSFFAIGFILAFFVTEARPAQLEPGYLMVFAAGAIAICAMILPGISGSFILLLLGLYGYIIQALKNLDLAVVLVFAAGCGTGLLAFVHALSWLLKHYYHQALAFLTGMLLASLNALWPWKQVVEYYQSGDKLKPLVQKNISPSYYELLTGNDAMLMYCILLAVTGLVLVLALERLTEDS